ncbi:hypothetical protein DRQ09_03730 [candidate division KSB1 bacterium]|nr:MAG: hypothetical protein DRQ09_03730 [candidate division KSB1 bacterium]
MKIDNIFKALTEYKNFRAKRISSWDRTGGNDDYIKIRPYETVNLAKIEGPGCISHIWFTIKSSDRYYLRKLILRMFWDGEKYPSVETPVGDFFGVGHAKTSAFCSFPLNMTSGTGEDGGLTAMNCYFNMPYSDSAIIEVINDSDTPVDSFYYYIDYEIHNEIGNKPRFHALWRRENPCKGWTGKSSEQTNLTGKNNYVILEATGKGHYVGCVLNIHNRSTGWWGEGDDMIFVDGEKWPPSLHGTGTEDYFCNAWGMQDERYLFSGASLFNKKHRNWEGKWSIYRFHILDPIPFEKSIKVTIEHGHANNRNDDYSSVAYWYQSEPHKKFPELLPVELRLPEPD